MLKKIRVNVDYIRPDSMLLYPLYADTGEKILSERMVLSQRIIDEIRRKHGAIIYYIDTSEMSIVPGYRMNIALNQSREVMNEIASTGKFTKSSFRDVEKVVEEIVSDLNSSEILAISLLKDLKSYDDYLYHHSVNVGVLSGAFAKMLDLPLEDIKNYTLGGYLIDIGHMMLDRQLMLKEGQYTISDRLKMKRHPQLAYELLKSLPGINPVVLQAVLFHHERFNDEGYFQMPYENLPMPPKVVAICDLFDALTSKRPYREAMSTTTALRVLLNSINVHFDYALVKHFLNLMGPVLNSSQSFYTTGDICELNTKELVLVQEIGQKDFLKPRVLIFCKFDRSSGKLTVKFYDRPVSIDLAENEDRYITRVLDNRQQVKTIKAKLKEKTIIN
jgi:hypothetical protein